MFFDEDERVTTPQELPQDENENILRPRKMSEYIGQDKVKDNLNVYIYSAKKRGDALDHVLLYGPPGLGKTSLAHIIANEREVDIRVTSGPAIERAGDLAAILTSLPEHSVLFIDEIHRLNRTVEEILYPAMEDFSLDMVLGKGPSARTIRIPLQPFTLIGATTKAGRLSAPLRDRFGIINRLEIYKPEELALIVRRSAGLLGIKIGDDACIEVASRSRGTPRIANRILKRLRDFAEFDDSDTITLPIAKKGLRLLEIDERGLDNVDINILKTMIERFGGGPVGLDTLAASTGEEAVTIEDVYEPYLLQIGFIARTSRGRVCLKDAYLHLGLPFVGRPFEPSLFDLVAEEKPENPADEDDQ